MSQKRRSIADESSNDDKDSDSDSSFFKRNEDTLTKESDDMKKRTAPKPAMVVQLARTVSAKGAASSAVMRAKSTATSKARKIVIVSDDDAAVSTPEFPAKPTAPKRRRRSVIARDEDEEDSSSVVVSVDGKSSLSSSDSSSSSSSDSEALSDGESTTSFDSSVKKTPRKNKKELFAPRRSAMRKQDMISEDQEIQRAMNVWVDASLPADFFRITAARTYCIECLKDEADSRLGVCRRCSGRVHLECLKHSQGRMRLCRDCHRWPNEIQSVLTWRKPTVPVQQRADDDEGLLLEYYIKWKARPHMANSFVSGRWLYRISYQRYLAFQRKLMPSLPVSKVVEPEWLELERVVAIEKVEGQQQYLVKWQTLGYEDTTWCTHKELEKLPRFGELVTKRKTITKTVRPEKREFVQLKGAPPFLSTEKKLFDYQLDGLNWMLYAWSTNTNCVLADEMGLGKTAQTVSFIAALETAGWRPALVVAPLSTLTHWQRELTEWTPHLNAVIFTGTPEGRDIIRQYELYAAPGSREPRFDVILTSFEGALIETSALRKFHWALVVVDEGQRLKNRESKLFGALKDFRTDHRLLLSGTPLQNNMGELFNMLEFLQLPQFNGKERVELQKEFEVLREKEQVTKLHEILRPHFLRRLKKDVLDFLPPKAEIVVPLSLSPLQQEYYKAILTKKLSFLRTVTRSSLLNVAMELRKCANHPYLCMHYLPAVIPAPEQAERLVNASSKLAFLHAMLPKLKAQGHRVLIFSQLTMMLDILEDYLKMFNYKWSRIDGSVAATDRQPIIDEFNAPNSELFCMLLSTRACRLGINLATADTVILFDSDWNPHNDIQAFSRVHRIGQKSKVAIYRLVVMQTIEEGIIRTARRKLVLDHLVVQRMHTQLQTGELDNILKIGTKELFEGVTPVITYDDSAMDKLLDRTHILAETNEEETAATEQGQEHYLGNLSNARVWEQASASVQASSNADPNYWTKLLAGRVKETQAEVLGKGQRKRRALSYIEDKSEEEEEEDEEENNNDESGDGKMVKEQGDEEIVVKKVKSRKKAADEEDSGWNSNGDSSSSDDEGAGDAHDNSDIPTPQLATRRMSALPAPPPGAAIDATTAAAALSTAHADAGVPPTATAPGPSSPAVGEFPRPTPGDLLVSVPPPSLSPSPPPLGRPPAAGAKRNRKPRAVPPMPPPFEVVHVDVQTPPPYVHTEGTVEAVSPLNGEAPHLPEEREALIATIQQREEELTWLAIRGNPPLHVLPPGAAKQPCRVADQRKAKTSKSVERATTAAPSSPVLAPGALIDAPKPSKSSKQSRSTRVTPKKPSPAPPAAANKPKASVPPQQQQEKHKPQPRSSPSPQVSTVPPASVPPNVPIARAPRWPPPPTLPGLMSLTGSSGGLSLNLPKQ